MAIKSTLLSGTGPDTIYQSFGETAVATTYFCNVSSSLVTINIHLVPFGETATMENLIYWALQIDSNDTYIMDTERLVLDQGDTIVVEASFPNSVVATVSYFGV